MPDTPDLPQIRLLHQKVDQTFAEVYEAGRRAGYAQGNHDGYERGLRSGRRAERTARAIAGEEGITHELSTMSLKLLGLNRDVRHVLEKRDIKTVAQVLELSPGQLIALLRGCEDVGQALWLLDSRLRVRGFARMRDAELEAACGYAPTVEADPSVFGVPGALG